MNLIVWIVVGLIVGGLARLLMPGSDPMGFLGTLVIGVLGAIVGGYVWGQIFGDTTGPDWIGSIIAAMVLLVLYRQMAGRRSG